MEIRRGQREDVPAVLALVRQVVPLMRSEGNFQWDDQYPNAAVFERDVDHGWLWIAAVQGQVAAAAAITTEQEPEYAEVGWDLGERAVVVHRLLVDPARRGLGLAAALMRQAEDVARSWDIAVLRVDTNRENGATQRLFPSLGYAFAGEIGLGFRPGLRFNCYEKRLR